ncbi:hypothetical protein BDD12DRAFT_978219 [Trichophaea hybrida]|nr:hypothetical protein BDD12DRAFT_978219 [Trichophaea hybrida]
MKLFAILPVVFLPLFSFAAPNPEPVAVAAAEPEAAPVALPEAEAIAFPNAEADAFAEPDADAFPQPHAKRQNGGPPVPAPTSTNQNFRSSPRPRTITCRCTQDRVPYRTCTRNNSRTCPARGFYYRRQSVTFNCITYGEGVSGNRYWVRAQNGYYSSAYYFSSCSGGGYLNWC